MKSCQSTGSRHQGLLADYTVLTVPISLVNRVKVYNAYRTDLQTHKEFTLEVNI